MFPNAVPRRSAFGPIRSRRGRATTPWALRNRQKAAHGRTYRKAASRMAILFLPVMETRRSKVSLISAVMRQARRRPEGATEPTLSAADPRAKENSGITVPHRCSADCCDTCHLQPTHSNLAPLGPVRYRRVTVSKLSHRRLLVALDRSRLRCERRPRKMGVDETLQPAIVSGTEKLCRNTRPGH